MNEEHTFRRGEIYLANLGFGYGSEQGGVRPVVILQNNIGNIYCPTLIVAPLTTKISKKPNQPTHYQISGDGANIRPSVVLLSRSRPSTSGGSWNILANFHPARWMT